MRFPRKRGSTSVMIRVFIPDNSVTTGAGLTGLTSASTNLTIAYVRELDGSSTTYTGANVEAQTTVGTYQAPSSSSKVRFKAVDATAFPGLYEIQFHDSATAFGTGDASQSVIINVYEATTTALKIGPNAVLIPLVPWDYQDGVRMGLTALPNAAAEAAGGLYTRGSGAGQINQDATGRVDVNIKALLGTAWLTPAVAGTPDVNAKLVGGGTVPSGAVPNAVAGAVGGLFIAGSNAATTISGLTTGALSCTTITASGAVAFQSTFAVTTSTSLGALSCTTLTASGAVAFQSTFAVTTSTSLAALSASTVTFSSAVAFQSTFTVTGATTLTGAVSFGSTWGVTGAVTFTAGLASNIAGNITGNLSGSVNSVTAGVTLGNVAHGGPAATLRLGAAGATPPLYVTNSGGMAAEFTTSAANTPAVSMDASANGGRGLDLVGSATNGTGLNVTGNNAIAVVGQTAALYLGSVANVIVLDPAAGSYGVTLLSTGKALAPKVVESFFDVDSGLVYSGAVAGSVVKEIADHATTVGGTVTLAASQPNYAPAKAGDAMTLTTAALASFFTTNSGKTYADAVAGSVVKEIVTNAGGLTVQAIVNGVWDEANASHLTAGTTGAKLNAAGAAGDPWGTIVPDGYPVDSAGYRLGTYLNAPVANGAGGGAVVSSDQPYVTPADVVVRADWRALSDWCSDGDPADLNNKAVRLTRTQLLTNAVLLELIREACGEFEASLLASQRYSPADVFALINGNTNAGSQAKGIVSNLVLYKAWGRRPRTDDQPLPMLAADAKQTLERLRMGEIVFALANVTAAGLMDISQIKKDAVVARGLASTKVRRWLGPRNEDTTPPG